MVLAWLGMLAYVFIVPGSPVDGLYACPFNALTGYDCPGCGMTRASVLAVKLDVAQSVRYNPFGVVFVLGLTVLALFRGAELIVGRPIEVEALRLSKSVRNRLWLALLVIAMGFGVGRLALELAGILTPL